MAIQTGNRSQRETAAGTLMKDKRIEPVAKIGTGASHQFGFDHSLVAFS